MIPAFSANGFKGSLFAAFFAESAIAVGDTSGASLIAKKAKYRIENTNIGKRAFIGSKNSTICAV